MLHFNVGGKFLDGREKLRVRKVAATVESQKVK